MERLQLGRHRKALHQWQEYPAAVQPEVAAVNRDRQEVFIEIHYLEVQFRNLELSRQHLEMNLAWVFDATSTKITDCSRQPDIGCLVEDRSERFVRLHEAHSLDHANNWFRVAPTIEPFPYWWHAIVKEGAVRLIFDPRWLM